MRDDDRTNVEVLRHLKDENAYTESITSRLRNVRTCIYDDMIRRMKETDHTTPVSDGDEYVYYRRTFEGKSYGCHCRAPAASFSTSASASAAANVIDGDVDVNDDVDDEGYRWDGSIESPVLRGEVRYLDENALAEGREYCDVGSAAVSPSHRLLAYSVDFEGGERYGLIRVVGIEDGNVVEELGGEEEVKEEKDESDGSDCDRKMQENDDDGEETEDAEKVGGITETETDGFECDGSIVWGADDSTLGGVLAADVA